MTLTTTKDAKGRVPVLMMFGGFGVGGGRPPAFQGRRGPGPGGFGPPGASRTEMLIKAGWGCATLSPGSIQADNGAGVTMGIMGLCNKGKPRKPDDWGSLRAWAWGASRAAMPAAVADASAGG